MKRDKPVSNSIWRRTPFVFGIALTAGVVAFAAYSLFYWPLCSGIDPCMSNWDHLRYDAGPNEIGDMLAGFAGALAFIWIVVTVMLQATELREQREQFEKMANAQSEQVVQLVRQGKILENEEDQRTKEILRDLVNEKLETIVSYCNSVNEHEWNGFSRAEESGAKCTRPLIEIPEDYTWEKVIQNLLVKLQEFDAAFDRSQKKVVLEPLGKGLLQELSCKTKEILCVLEGGSNTDKEHWKRLPLKKCQEILDNILNKTEWDSNKEGEGAKI